MTVSRILRKARLSRARDPDPAEPVRRYERDHPGKLLYVAIKTLDRFDRVGHRITDDRTGQSNARGINWKFVHICIDDNSRSAFSQMLTDEKKESVVAFLQAAVACYRNLGIVVACVMTNNGACYKSFTFSDACKALGLKYIRTRPCTPKTSSKAERFIQALLREWTCARAYLTSEHRKDALGSRLHIRAMATPVRSSVSVRPR